MFPNILHRDLFGIEISHEKQPLTVYDNKEDVHGAQEDIPMSPKHVGDFSGLINKNLFHPVVLPKLPQGAEVKPLTYKQTAAEAFGRKQVKSDKGIKQLQFQLRKAEARLDVAGARLEQTASEVGQDDIAYHRAVLHKAKAVHNVRKAELEVKEAELGDKKDNEYFKLQTRKAKAHLEVVKAEGMLMRKLESQDSQK
ncbi:hypothetical protein MBLNU13_g04898t1 [Cladosporium sp. NU13]